ncbi:MAG: tetratricopeptide repeat protein [Gammaproteobacteria bacterium]|nr:tetratricopeptide repeat protein [Gammaproteobacteria bacterium]
MLLALLVKSTRRSYRKSLSHLFETQDAYSAFDQAMGLARKGHYDDALSFVDRALSMEPAEPRFYGLKGDLLLERKEFEAAMDQFDKALARDDGYYEYYLGRGLALAELGQTGKARQALERSHELLPTAVASKRLGDLYLAAGERDQAKRHYGAAMEAPGPIGERAKKAFTKLDLPDQPARYLPARPVIEGDGRFRADIANRTGYIVSGAAFEFSAVVNGQPRRKVIVVPRITPNSQGRINAGWRFSENDVVESVGVRAVGVESIGEN